MSKRKQDRMERRPGLITGMFMAMGAGFNALTHRYTTQPEQAKTVVAEAVKERATRPGLRLWIRTNRNGVELCPVVKQNTRSVMVQLGNGNIIKRKRGQYAWRRDKLTA